MKPRSLRSRFAIFCALLVAGTLVVFAGLSAALFYHEQLEAFSEDHTVVPSADDRSEAWEGGLTLVSSYALLLPAAALGSAAIGWFFATRFLRHLTQLADSADRISIHNLQDRLEVPATLDEVSRLTKAMNELLGRLEASITQIKRFTADASHELRMPLTVMKCEVEALLRDGTSGFSPDAGERLLLEINRLTRLCESLLFLARADADEVDFDPRGVNLSALGLELLEDAQALAESWQIKVDALIEPDVQITGDLQLVRRLLQNLLDNAVKHNVNHGWIRFSIGVREKYGSLVIANSGTPIPPGEQTRLFQRFHRVDPVRATNGSGAGLGLSICREIVALHGGSISLISSNANETSFQVLLPLQGREIDGISDLDETAELERAGTVT